MASRILVVHYSRTGHTRQLAEQIANALGADLESISDPTQRGGAIGFLRSAYEAIRQRLPDIGAPAHDPDAYAMVVVGTPIWSRSVATPVLSYLRRHRGALRSVAFFCTCGRTGGAYAFARMSSACGQPPVSTLTVYESELARPPAAAIERFVADVRAAVERAPELPPRPGRGEGPRIV